MTAIQVSPDHYAIAEAVARRVEQEELRRWFQPSPTMSISQWADARRIVSAGASSIPGPWRTSLVPYAREIMDTIGDPRYRSISWMKPNQVSASEIILNAVGYYIDQDPSPILVVLPNVDPMARKWSRTRFAPMVRDTPCLRKKVSDAKSRDSSNTVLEKTFRRGYLSVIGANSAAGLSMSPIRCAFFDEVDRFPASAGTEGDPIELGTARTDTYGDDAIIVKFSTPADEPSRIAEAYQESDQRQYWVPCPLCGHEQLLEWRDADGDYRLIWEKDKHGKHLPETAKYLCKECGGLIDEIDKPAMLAAGYWKAEKPEVTDVAGFHSNILVSPFFSWADTARMFLNVRGNPDRLKTFVNLKLAEVWDPEKWIFNDTELAGRRERFRAEIPKPVGILTAAVDVQGDRLEFEVDGWGVGHECWTITHERIYGNPVEGEVWEALEALLTKPWEHESGSTLRILCCLIDSGYLADEVYRFVKPRQRRRVYAAKGLGGDHVQLVKRAQRPDKHRIRLVTVGTDTAKDKLFPRLAMTEPGPGYIHYGPPTDTGLDEEYFAQLKGEKIDYRIIRGRRVRYYKQIRKRNEAIDLKVMNLAAFHLLGAGITEQMQYWVDRANQKQETTGETKAAKPRRGGVISEGVEL